MASRKHIFIDFRVSKPAVSTNAVGQIGVVTAAATNVVKIGRHTLDLYNDGQNDLILPVQKSDANSTTGLRFQIDAADNDGVHVAPGTLADALMPYAFKIGTDPAFQLRVKLGIPDVSDLDVVCIGFRKAAAAAACASHAATGTAYTDLAALNVNAGAIYTVTRLNTLTATLTDTTNTWADNAVKELAVLVSAAGVVTFQIDGAAPTVNTNTLTFDSTDIVIPFIQITRAGAGTDQDDLPVFEYFLSGYQ